MAKIKILRRILCFGLKFMSSPDRPRPAVTLRDTAEKHGVSNVTVSMAILEFLQSIDKFLSTVSGGTSEPARATIRQLCVTLLSPTGHL